MFTNRFHMVDTHLFVVMYSQIFLGNVTPKLN